MSIKVLDIQEDGVMMNMKGSSMPTLASQINRLAFLLDEPRKAVFN